MSILKRLIVEDIRPLLRRPSAEESRGHSVRPSGLAPDPTQVRRPDVRTATQPGMKAVILNWKAGENDPFSVMNGAIAQHFRACGKNVVVIEIADGDWPSRLAELAPAGVEFAFTWQGLGSPVTMGQSGESLWDHLKIPLICLHGDHPCHMPLNHGLESRYCFHLYTNADFARYSNRHFRRSRGASVIDVPQLHREHRLDRRTGDHFVFAKNINDPAETERFWQERLEKPVFDMYMAAAETLKSRIAQEAYIEIHDVLDDLLSQRGLEPPGPGADLTAYHQFHSQLDHYIRSHKSIVTVTALRDFPIRIYGRGWGRIAQSAPASHIFEPARNMADSQDLYYTRFGLIDVSPSKALHDRTRRAMVNGSGFLSSANLEDSFADIARFDRLFFTFRPSELAEKCAAVVRDPEGHREAAQRFACAYHERFHFRDFVRRIEQLAKVAVPFAA